MKRTEGSYTVEAAIIVPLLLAIILALIQICFVLHDRVVIRGALERTVLQMTEQDGEHQENERVDGESWFGITEIEERLLISEITDLEINKIRNGYETLVHIKTRRIVPLYLGSGETYAAKYFAKRKRTYAKEKVIISEVLLDTLQVLQ